jgi:hypothetical protein
VFHAVCAGAGDVCEETVAELFAKLEAPVRNRSCLQRGEGGIRILAVPLQVGFTVYPK